MHIIDVIDQKRRGLELAQAEIKQVIQEYVDGKLPDYQMSALLMAICFQGMTMKETVALTEAMIESGKRITFPDPTFLVDKHSTGGVGDKTTLILAPLVASCGVIVPKMSGRGLGYTGGTIDKLEAISGFQTNLQKDDFLKKLYDIGVAIIAGSQELVPADKKIYALRDATATVSSIPLIASSIMSKKIAAGSKKLVIDVKVGAGALMEREEDARLLAQTMIAIGKEHGVKTVCVLSKMSEPLGYAIGNGLEVLESIDALKGNWAPDLKELVFTLGSIMVSLGKNISVAEAQREVQQNLERQTAYQKFVEVVKYQKGDLNHIACCAETVDILSLKDGYIQQIDAFPLAVLARNLGAGRSKKEDQIDHGVGIWLKKKTGDFVNVGDVLATVYTHEKLLVEDYQTCFHIGSEKKNTSSIIIDIVEN